MSYGFYSHRGWCPPWGPYAWLANPMFGGWPPPYPPYSGMGEVSPNPPAGFGQQMPFHPGAGMPPYRPPVTPVDEVAFLRNRAHMLQEELNYLEGRLGELEREDR